MENDTVRILLTTIVTNIFNHSSYKRRAGNPATLKTKVVIRSIVCNMEIRIVSAMETKARCIYSHTEKRSEYMPL